MIFVNHYIYFKSDVAKILDYNTYDFLSEVLAEKKDSNTSSNVIVVDIDEKSMDALGQWPWPRVMLAQVMHKVDASYPSAIGFDILFPEKDRASPKEISAFYENFFNIKTSLEGLPQSFLDNDLIFSAALTRTKSVMGLYLSNDDLSNKECHSLHPLDLNLSAFDIITPLKNKLNNQAAA